MELVRTLRDVTKNDTAIAGGKGAGLGELMQAGFTVPNGFVVLASAYDFFLKDTDINVEIDAVMKTVDLKKMHTVENASEKIQALMLNADMPMEIANAIEQAFAKLGAGEVAVRSSATAEDSQLAAWAGQLETYLHTKKETLLENVQRCWASLFSPRAIFYRLEMAKNTPDISVAVVVQEMVQSDYAGVAFSVHPVTQDKHQMLIEAVAGLGDQLVAGNVTPDTYVLDKDAWNLIDVNRSGDEQLLNHETIIALGKDIARIEQHCTFPADVEWALQADQRVFLQVRPITTLPSTQEKPLYDTSIDWVHYLTRTKNLFMASLWQEWYGSDRLKEIVGFTLPNVLFLEQDTNVIRFYREADAHQKFLDAIEQMVREQPDKLLTMYQRADELNAEAEQHIAIGAAAFANLESGVDFLVDQALHATVIPYLSLKCIGEKQLDFPEAEKHAERLRAISYYPEIMHTNLMPLAKQRLQELGVEDVDAAVDLVTLNELYTGSVADIPDRIARRQRGQRFIYQYLNGKETVAWTDDIFKYITRLESWSHQDSGNALKGITAFAGKAKGIARVVLTDDIKDITFNEGDILVSVHSSPTLMPLINKCSAIVTDEGGASCHAAIISRELKKPCVMSTKVATITIKDGDEIEVDADNGRVILL